MPATPGLQRPRRALLAAELAKAQVGKPSTALAGVVPPGALKPQLPEGVLMLEKWVQAALNVALGMKLPVDGVLKGETRLALMRFQKEAGLTAHGYLDEKTLQALEQWVGAHAPREGRHGGLSRLWQVGDRPAERLPPPPEKPKRPEGLTVQQERAQAAQKLLQREAELAVEHEAFARDFVEEQMERLGRQGAAALHAEMQAWLEAARRTARDGNAPEWLSKVETAARSRPQEATAALRAAWLGEHAAAGKETAP